MAISVLYSTCKISLSSKPEGNFIVTDLIAPEEGSGRVVEAG
jgi:hypothetical protein